MTRNWSETSVNMDDICQYCLSSAIQQTWENGKQNIDIDNIELLLKNYIFILKEVSGILKIPYSPYAGWLWFFAYLSYLKTSGI